MNPNPLLIAIEDLQLEIMRLKERIAILELRNRNQLPAHFRYGYGYRDCCDPDVTAGRPDPSAINFIP